MKRFFAVLSSLLVLPAFAEVAPVYYDEIVEYTDEMIDAIDDAPVAEDTSVAKAPQNSTNRATSRTAGVSRSEGSVRTAADSIRNAQRNALRSTVARTAKTAQTKQGIQRQSSSRASGVTSRARQSAKTASSSSAVRARVGMAQNSTVGAANKSTTQGYVTTVSNSGSPLYINNRSGQQSTRVASARRISTARLSTAATPVVTEADVSTTASNLEAITELTDYCKAQYAACMDNYCNVLDDNQGRCSCSKNIKNYQKVEDALTQASSDFQDVVQKIKYIGLTKEQVNALFDETEAELTMSQTKDQSKLSSSLDSIKRKIIDATSPNSSSYVVDSAVSMDLSGLLNFDLASAFDLGAFLNTGSKNNTTSVTNQRGEQLYKSATARCKTAILDSCTSQGVEANIITNSYDLEIDKQCIVYERNLNDANAEMKDNVRNAGIILQQARLMLAQNKNSYDFRGCVAAIDSCMQDEYVCGSDYELCLDPTGKYIAGGEIVKGGTPGIPGGNVVNTTDITTGNMDTWTSKGMYDLYAAWNYGPTGDNAKNAWGGGKKENLGDFISYQMEEWASNYNQDDLDTGNMATYLLQKIGYIDANDKTHGMCASVMKQCQDYTFESKSSNSKPTFKPANDVIKQYLQTVLSKIKVQQDAILSDYAEDCQSDVTSCLSSNGYDETQPEAYSSNTAIAACRTEIQTCMSVSGSKPSDNTQFTLRAMADWIKLFTLSCPVNYYIEENSSTHKVSCKPCPTINNVATSSAGGYVMRCTCGDGYRDVVSDDGVLTSCQLSNNN